MKIKKLIFIVLMTFSIICVSSSFFTKRMESSYAENTTSKVNYSIFIREPSYSTIFNDNIYFYDGYDKLLKIYNTAERTFLNTYISLSDYTIQDINSYENNLFIIATAGDKQYILAIDLSTLSLKTIELENTGFVRLFSTKLIINDSEKYVLSLTNDVNILGTKPQIMVLSNDYTLESTSVLDFNLNGTDDTVISISQNLFKFIIINSESNPNELLLVFVYQNYVSYTDNIMISDILSNKSISVNKTLPACNFLETNDSDYELDNVNLIKISNESYFFITYTNTSATSNKIVPIIYNYTLDGINNTSFNLVKHLENLDCNYITTNYDYCIYSNKQSIYYTKYSFDEESSSFTDLSGNVLNPDIKITYTSTENLQIKITTNETAIYSTPWDSAPICEIPENYDIIDIGKGYIEIGNIEINDYAYCLCTINDKNITGYIKVTDIADKDKISPETYEYSIVKAVPNTNLYSFPTKVLTQVTAENVQIGVISQIVENSRVEIIDPICRYTANNTTYVKVKVNDLAIGYIDYSNIITPSSYKDFIETNASIKQDNTLVYLNTEAGSPVIYKLNKNYRVRINGSRDTKTGYTSITFNDEYGNEFSGYIITDTLSTDNWSTLQIIGCVLIAINIGLLILILLFKKHKIGNNGTKYLNSQKENYKK